MNLTRCLAVASALFTATQAFGCIGYRGPVTLRGRVITRTYPGPPNYESVARGDRAESPSILRLDRPTCVDADPNDKDGMSPGFASIRHVQLTAGTRVPTGRRVRVTGTILLGISGHHHTEVLLDVQTYERVNGR